MSMNFVRMAIGGTFVFRVSPACTRPTCHLSLRSACPACPAERLVWGLSADGGIYWREGIGHDAFGQWRRIDGALTDIAVVGLR